MVLRAAWIGIRNQKVQDTVGLGSESLKTPWAVDLKVFAVLSVVWAGALTVQAATGAMLFSYAPMEALAAGLKFHGESARIVLAIKAVIFLLFAAGILAECRWGLILALCYLAEAVMSHFIFIFAYLYVGAELMSVQMAAFEGPVIVLLLLYVWIRSQPILFETH